MVLVNSHQSCDHAARRWCQSILKGRKWSFGVSCVRADQTKSGAWSAVSALDLGTLLIRMWAQPWEICRALRKGRGTVWSSWSITRKLHCHQKILQGFPQTLEFPKLSQMLARANKTFFLGWNTQFALFFALHVESYISIWVLKVDFLFYFKDALFLTYLNKHQQYLISEVGKYSPYLGWKKVLKLKCGDRTFHNHQALKNKVKS